MARIFRLDDLEKEKIPEGYEEFASNGASSSTIQLRPIQRDADGLLIRPNNGEVTLHVYNNGFRINNEAFRPISEEANQRFLETITAGDVPQELEKNFRGTAQATDEQVKIKMNRIEEDWEEPKAANAGYDFNQGRGQTLLTAPHVRDEQLSQLPAVAYVPPSGATTVVIQLQLINRQRVRLNVTNDTTIAQIYQHINSLTSGIGEGELYILQGGFPAKEFSEGDKTVGELKLAGSALAQKKFEKK